MLSYKIQNKKKYNKSINMCRLIFVEFQTEHYLPDLLEYGKDKYQGDLNDHATATTSYFYGYLVNSDRVIFQVYNEDTGEQISIPDFYYDLSKNNFHYKNNKIRKIIEWCGQDEVIKDAIKDKQQGTQLDQNSIDYIKNIFNDNIANIPDNINEENHQRQIPDGNHRQDKNRMDKIINKIDLKIQKLNYVLCRWIPDALGLHNRIKDRRNKLALLFLLKKQLLLKEQLDNNLKEIKNSKVTLLGLEQNCSLPESCIPINSDKIRVNTPTSDDKSLILQREESPKIRLTLLKMK